MATHIQYPHAPIVEALIDFRLKYAEGTSLETLKNFGSAIRSEYPLSATRDLIEAQMKSQDVSTAASSSRKVIGYIFHSADRKQAVQARLDGFTFSRFAPYENWDKLKTEAHRLWGVFLSAVRTERVTRVALRYVNQLNLPLKDGTLTFDNYLNTFPKIGERSDHDQILEGFFMRLVLPQTDLQSRLVLTETLVPPEQAFTSLGVILDLDLFRDGVSFEVQSNEIWALLDLYRERKNWYFEASITEATRELFK